MIEPYTRKIAFRADNAGCDRAGAPVVRGVSMTLEPGMAVQLFGANGSGKTSLLNLFAGHLRPAEGALGWRADDGPWSPARPAGAICFMGHEDAVKPALSAAENLCFWARTYGLGGDAARKAVCGALERVGLGARADARAGRLSTGQRRRVCFARALLCRREAWLLDEPAGALDADGARFAAEIITAHLAAGGVAIVATHHPLAVNAERLEIG